jgi:hypothetical protein
MNSAVDLIRAVNLNSAVNFEEPAGAVAAEIDFLRPTLHRPYTYGYEPSGQEPPQTAVFETHRIPIRNARTAARRLSLEKHGMTLIEHRSSVRDFYGDGQITDVYYPESAAVIGAYTGASRVLVFDHNLRRGLSLPLAKDRKNQGRPVLHAHTDFTEASAVRRLRDLVGQEAADLLSRRVMQVNLWRPIRAPLRDTPLAICDATSIGLGCLTAVDLIYPERRGEIYYLTYDAAQRWYYAPDMRVDEAWIIKNYDSAAVSTAGFAAHSAFTDPTPNIHVLPRESIEVRAFALFDA